MDVRPVLQDYGQPYPSTPQPNSPYPNQPITTEEALAAFINADGNLNLCAERTGCDRADIVQALSQDLPRLQQQLRVLSVINLCHESNTVRRRVRETVGELEASEAMRAYIGLQQLVVTLTDDKTSTQNININEMAYQRLPRSIQEVMVELERLEQAKTTQLVTAGQVYDGEGENDELVS